MGKKVNGFIIDSSVILNTILEDEKTNKSVVTFLEKESSRIQSIQLIKIEISNCLAMKIEDLDLLKEIYEKFSGLEIKIINIDEFSLELARQIAFNIKDTVYDALYHSVAILNDLVFITLDKRYYAKAKKLGHIRSL